MSATSGGARAVALLASDWAAEEKLRPTSGCEQPLHAGKQPVLVVPRFASSADLWQLIGAQATSAYRDVHSTALRTSAVRAASLHASRALLVTRRVCAPARVSLDADSPHDRLCHRRDRAANM